MNRQILIMILVIIHLMIVEFVMVTILHVQVAQNPGQITMKLIIPSMMEAVIQ